MGAVQYASSRSNLFQGLGAGGDSDALLRKTVRFGTWLALFGIGYYLTACLSHAPLFLSSRIGLFWAPNALLISALILTSRRSWWLILAVASVAHVLALGPVTPVWRMAWQIPVTAGVVIAMTEVFRRFVGFPLRFQSRREVLLYTFLAVLLPVPLALTAPGFVLSAAGRETWFTPSIEFVRLWRSPASKSSPTPLPACRMCRAMPCSCCRRCST